MWRPGRAGGTTGWSAVAGTGPSARRSPACWPGPASVLGYIPAGTTNDFSRNLGLPRGVEKAAATAAAGFPPPL